VSKTMSRINIPSSWCLRPFWEEWQTFLADSWTHTDRRLLADWFRVSNQHRAWWATLCGKEEDLLHFEVVCASKFRVLLYLVFFFFPFLFYFSPHHAETKLPSSYSWACVRNGTCYNATESAFGALANDTAEYGGASGTHVVCALCRRYIDFIW
jgi:hypothetical protein